MKLNFIYTLSFVKMNIVMFIIEFVLLISDEHFLWIMPFIVHIILLFKFPYKSLINNNKNN